MTTTDIEISSPEYAVPVNELQLVLDRVTSPNPGPIAIVGVPGVGKTSLLRFVATAPRKEISRFLREPYRSHPDLLLPVSISFRTIGITSHPFAQMLTSVLEHLRKRSDVSIGTRDMGDTLAYSAKDAAEAMEALLQACEEKGIRPVLLLDDFDQTFRELHATDAARLRPRRAAAMVMALEYPLEMSNQDASTSPFFQLVQHVWMRGLSSREARALLSAISGAPLQDVENLARLVMPFPLVLEKAAQILRDERTRRDLTSTTPLSEELRTLFTNRLREDLRGTLEFYWGRLDGRHKELLRTLAEDSETQEDGAARAFLENRGLIDYEARVQKYRVRGSLFAEFVTSQGRRPSGLSDFEAELYDYLRSRQPEVSTIEQIFSAVWKNESNDADVAAGRRVQVAVSRLRRKLEEKGRETIVNVREHGYRLEAL